jgi:hypothetical protein
MPQLEAQIRAEGTVEDVVPGEFAVAITFTNRSNEPARLNTHQAAHPALVLDVRDSKGETLLLPPPSAPDAQDLEPGELISPGERVSITYVGFLDRSLPAGEYRVRYFSEFPALGGSREDPLRSEWMTFTVRPTRGFPIGKEVPRLRPSPEDVRPEQRRMWQRLLGRLWIYISRFWRWPYFLLIRWILRRPCDRVLSQEVDQPRTETISNAPPGAEAWNGTYGWRARFLLTVDEPGCTARVVVRVRLVGTITATQRSAWESAIEAAWNARFKLCCGCCCCINGSEIVSDIQFISSGEHQVVNIGGITTNMGNWGANDTVDISHEFGHMLGALDEYFTVNGVDFGPGYQPTGAIMNNPENPPAGRHYDVVRAAAASLLGRNCSTVSRSAVC